MLICRRRWLERQGRTPDVEACGRCEVCLSRPVESTPAAATDERPAVRAPKAAWVDFAVAQGMDRADAEASSKADLIATLS